MRAVLVGNIKGGCGKTTIATHLATYFAAQGHSTAIADCDRQRSSLGWLKRRDPTLPTIQGLDWSKDVGKPGKSIERLIIDAPAAMHHKDVEELIDIADSVVIPVLPGAFDQDATAHFLKKLSEVKAVRKNKRLVAIVGNRLRSGTKAVEALDVFFSGLGFPVVARLRDSQSYTHCAESGSSVLESKDRRIRDHARDWQPLLTLLGP
jgi:chromosome partitioning protein